MNHELLILIITRRGERTNDRSRRGVRPEIKGRPGFLTADCSIAFGGMNKATPLRMSIDT